MCNMKQGKREEKQSKNVRLPSFQINDKLVSLLLPYTM